MRRLVLVAGLSALALAACSKKPHAAATQAAPGAQAAGAASDASLQMPPRAPGLWSQTITNGDTKQTIKICLDDQTDKKMALWSQGMGMEQCSKNEHHWDGKTVSFSSECDMPPSGHVSSHGTASGDFNSHYTVTIKGTVTGAAMSRMNGTNTTVIEAVRQGDCPAGWKGGDMELPRVGKVNLEEMQKKAEQLRGLSGKIKFN